MEARFAKEVLIIAATALEQCFETVTQVSFKLDRLETSVEFTILGPNDMPVVAAQILFQVMDNGGRMFILIPQAALYPIRKKLAREHQPVSLANDPRWTQQMQRGISRTEVTLQAILETRIMALGEITQFKVGQLLQLRAHTQDLIAIQSGTEQVFRAKLGQANGKFLFVIETVSNLKETPMDAIDQGRHEDLKHGREELRRLRPAATPEYGPDARADLVQRQHFVGAARVGNGARHAVDHAARLILDEVIRPGLMQVDELPHAVIAHAGQHDAQHVLAEGRQRALGQHVDARLIQAFPVIRLDLEAGRGDAQMHTARADIDGAVDERLAVRRLDDLRRAAGVEALGQCEGELRRHVLRDHDRHGKIGGKLADHVLKRLRPAGAAADDDDLRICSRSTVRCSVRGGGTADRARLTAAAPARCAPDWH